MSITPQDESLIGRDAPTAQYNRVVVVFTFGGSDGGSDDGSDVSRDGGSDSRNRNKIGGNIHTPQL